MEPILEPNSVEIIQIALVPIFLIVGIGTLVNVATGRLARIIDRIRWFENLEQDKRAQLHQKTRYEIQSLNKRMGFANWSINFLVAAAVVTCLNVMVIMTDGIVNTNLDVTILLVFILSMALLTGGLISFFLEVSLATATLKYKALDMTGFPRNK